MSALAIDVGSTSIRTARVATDGSVTHVHQQRLRVTRAQPGEVELDAEEIASLALDLSRRTLHDGGLCDVVGITNQRATTVLFDPSTGRALGPALSWQDLRTVIDCLILQGDGLRLAPNQSATKIKWLLDYAGRPATDVRFATLETWIAWHLSDGAVFVSDRSNAAVTGVLGPRGRQWDDRVIDVLGLAASMFAPLVDTMQYVGDACALPGSPSITALVGDQSASIFGQSCVSAGAKITFGTGAMLDVIHDVEPVSMLRLPGGCFPMIARSRGGISTWGVEGIAFSAGSCVEWLVELGLLEDAASSHEVASSVTSSEGVSFVPAFSGLGTPYWDFGARGAFFGLTRGSSRAHLVRAVLEGVAQRGADLLEAAEGETGSRLEELRVDGGMSANTLFVQRLSDVTGRAVAVSAEREATTRGAGLMALVAADALSLEDVAQLWRPAFVAWPSINDDERASSREQWRRDVERARGMIPALSDVSF